MLLAAVVAGPLLRAEEQDRHQGDPYLNETAEQQAERMRWWREGKFGMFIHWGKKDLLAPLAEAVRKRGMKFGLYYSQAQDWVHPGGAKGGYKPDKGWDPAQNGSFDAYLKSIAVPQVQEILSRYQPAVLWWDTPVEMNNERAALFNDVLREHPGIITNDRLGGDFAGDIETPGRWQQELVARASPSAAASSDSDNAESCCRAVVR